jgi:hypothetical protein
VKLVTAEERRGKRQGGVKGEHGYLPNLLPVQNATRAENFIFQLLSQKPCLEMLENFV